MSKVHAQNRLNDLTNREWLVRTKSVWMSEARDGIDLGLGDDWLPAFRDWLLETRGPDQTERILGQLLESWMISVAPPRDALKAQHPATFSERDIEKLIELFTKQGERVLDPFVGVGSTLIACRRTGRGGVGIELVPRWAEAARERLAAEQLTLPVVASTCVEVLEGDARVVPAALDADSFHFVVTSPPYWSILRKKPSMKVKAERVSKGLGTHYSESAADLGNVADYQEFLEQLGVVFSECLRVLIPGRYMCVVVCDFRHGSEFVLYHADIARTVEAQGFSLQGVTVLVQDNKNLYPYGIPNAFVSNIHHQYILIFRKPKR
jgi:DNA modification methylase